MKALENMEIIGTYYTSGERIREELRKYLKKKRVQIEQEDEGGIVGWSDNRYVRIEIKNQLTVTLLTFYEKYSDEGVQIDRHHQTVGALTAAAGGMMGATSKGGRGVLTTAYGGSKILSAEKRMLSKLIGPTFKRNMLNLDAINESGYISEHCGRILAQGAGKSFELVEGKFKIITGQLKFGERALMFKSQPESGEVILYVIPREDIINISKDKVKVSLINVWPTMRIKTPERFYNFSTKDGRGIKKWINLYS